MDVIYGLIPGMLILGLVMVGVLFWAARSGQFDDLEGDAHRILMDEERSPKPKSKPQPKPKSDRIMPDAEDNESGETGK